MDKVSGPRAGWDARGGTPVVWLILVVAVLLGLGSVWWFTRGPSHGGLERYTHGAFALPPEEPGAAPDALALGYAHDHSGVRFFIDRVGADRLHWELETTPLRVGVIVGIPSVGIDPAAPDVIVALLLEENPGRHGEVTGISRATGERLWTTPLPVLPADTPRAKLRHLPLSEPVRVAGGRAYVVVEDVATGVMALDVKTGAVLWKRGLEQDMTRHFELGPAALALLQRGLWLLDPKTGDELARHEAFGATCRVGDVMLVRQRAGFLVVPLDGKPPMQLAVEGGVPWLEACARRGEGWIVVGRRGGQLIMQAIGEGPRPRWELDLEVSGFSLLSGATNGAGQGEGELSSRWPMVLYYTDPQGQQIDRLVVVDVDEGKILSRRDGDGAGIRMGTGFAIGARLGAVTLMDKGGWEITTVRVQGLEVVSQLSDGSRLWLFEGLTPALPGEQRRGVYDLSTGRRLGGSGVPFEVDPRGVAGAFPRVP